MPQHEKEYDFSSFDAAMEEKDTTEKEYDFSSFDAAMEEKDTTEKEYDFSSFDAAMEEGEVKKKDGTSPSESAGTGEETPSLLDTEETKTAPPAASSVSDEKKAPADTTSSFKHGIHTIESKGTTDPYKALPYKRDKNGDIIIKNGKEVLASSAAGKYQFLWDSHGEKIKKETGVKNKQEFLDSPKAQEKFMDHWVSSELKPSLGGIRDTMPKESKKYTDDEIMALIHFQGLPNAKKFLKTGKVATADTNVTVDKYLERFNEGMASYEPKDETIPGITSKSKDVSKSQQINPDADKINVEKYGDITDEMMNSAEEEVALMLDEKYGNIGMYFEEEGALSNKIKVVADNNESITISLKDEDPKKRAEQRQLLISFMEDNKADEKAYLKYKEEYDELRAARKLTDEQKAEINLELQEEFDESGFKDTIGKYYNKVKEEVDETTQVGMGDFGFSKWVFSKIGDYETYKEEAVGKAVKELHEELGKDTELTTEQITDRAKEIRRAEPLTTEQIIDRAKEIRRAELVEARREYNVAEFLDDLSDWGQVPKMEEKYKRALKTYGVGAAFQKNKALKRSAFEASEARAVFEKEEQKIKDSLVVFESMPEGEEKTAEANRLVATYKEVNKMYAEAVAKNKELSDNKKDIQDFALEADLFKREYGQLTNLSGRLGAGYLDMWIGVFKMQKDIIFDMPLQLAENIVESTAAGMGIDITEPGAMASFKEIIDDAQKESIKEEELIDKVSAFIDNDIRGNIRKQRSTDDLHSWSDWAQWTGDLFASQIPQLIAVAGTGPAGLTLLAGSAYGNKLQEMEEEIKTGTGDYDFWHMRGAAFVVGVGEYLSERVTQGIISKSMPSNRMFSAFSKVKKGKIKADFNIGIRNNIASKMKSLKGAALNATEEGTSEVFAQVMGNAADKYILGKDVGLLDGTKDAFLSGAVIGAGINVAGGMAGLILKPFISDGSKVIKNNLNEIAKKISLIEAMRKKPQTEDTKLSISLAESAIARMELENGSFILSGLSTMDKLSAAEIRSVSKAEDLILKLKDKYHKIKDSTTLSKEQKAEAIKEIDAQYNTIVENKSEILAKAKSEDSRYIINDKDVSAEEFKTFIEDEGNLEKLAEGRGYAKVINDLALQKEFINKIKPKIDAVQKRKTEEVDVLEQARDGEEVVEGVQKEVVEEAVKEEVVEAPLTKEEEGDGKVRFKKEGAKFPTKQDLLLKNIGKEGRDYHHGNVVDQVSYEKKSKKIPIIGALRKPTFVKVLSEMPYVFSKDKVTSTLKRWAKNNPLRLRDDGSIIISGKQLADLGLAKVMTTEETKQLEYDLNLTHPTAIDKVPAKFKKSEATTQEQAEEEAIVEQMDKMSSENVEIDVDDVITQKGAIDVDGLNERLSKIKGTIKAKMVQLADFVGMPIALTISDHLTTGESSINPITGKPIENLKGGLGYTYSEGNKDLGWAYTDEKKAKVAYDIAKEIYDNNEELFKKLWKEGKIPYGTIPLAVVKMGRGSMISNEAVARQIAENIAHFDALFSKDNKTKKRWEGNKKKAYKEIEKSIKANVKRLRGKVKAKTINKTEKKALDAYEFFVGENGFLSNNPTLETLVANMSDLDIGQRPLLIDYFTTGMADTRPVKVGKPKKVAAVALFDGFVDSNPEIKAAFHISRLIDNISEPSIENVPQGHIIAINAINVIDGGPVQTSTISADGKSTHPNYDWAVKGEAIGIVGDTAHVADVMPSVYGGVMNKLLGKEKKGIKTTTKSALSEALFGSLNQKLYRDSILSLSEKNRIRIIGQLKLAFPNTKFFTDQKTWDEMLENPDIKKHMSKDDKVWGFTYKKPGEKNTNIFLNPDMSDINTPIHEAGHLWVDLMSQNNKELYKKGLSLVDGTKEYEQAKKEYPDNDVMAREEALAILIGNQGQTIANAAHKSKFTNFLVAMWKYVRESFPILSEMSIDEIQNLTINEFVNGAIRDVLSGEKITGKPSKKGVPKFKKQKQQADLFTDLPQIFIDTIGGKRMYDLATEALIKTYNKTKDKDKAIAAAIKVLQSEWALANPMNKTLPNQMSIEITRRGKQSISQAPAKGVIPMQGVRDVVAEVFAEKERNEYKETLKEIREIKRLLKIEAKGAKNVGKLQQQLKNLINKIMPIDSYGKGELLKIVTLMKNVNDIDKLDSALDEIVVLATKKVTKMAQTKVESLIKAQLTTLEAGRLKGKAVSVRVEEMLNTIKDVYNKIHDKGKLKSIEEIDGVLKPIKDRIAEAKTLTNLNTKELDTLASLELAVEYAEATKLEDGTVAKMMDMIEVLDNIAELRKEGRSERRAAAAKRSEMYSDEIADIFRDITGKEIDELDDWAREVNEAKLDTKRTKRTKSIFKRFFARINRYFLRGYSLPYLIDVISKGFGEIMGGKAHELITDRINQSSRDFKARMLKLNVVMAEKLESIYGKNWKKEVEKNRELKVLKGITKPDGESYEMSQDTMYYLYNQYKDPSNHPAFEAAFKSRYAEVMKAITEQLDPRVKEWADWQVDELFPSLYPEYNETYKDMYGTNMPQHIKYAGRLYRKGVEQSDYDLLDNQKGFQTSIGAASTFARQNNKHPIDINMNGNDALMTYLTDMEHFNTHARTIKNVNKILTNKDIQTAIELNDGPEVLELLKHSLKMIARRGVMEGKNVKIVNALTDVFVFSRLGMNPTVGLKQLTSAFTYSNDIGLGNWLKYGVSNIAQMRSIWKEISENSSYIQDRYSNDIRKTIESYSENQMKKLVPGMSYSKALDMMMYFIKMGDKGGIMGGIPNYQFYKADFKKKNPSATEQDAIDYAIKKFEKDTKNTQQSSDIIDKDFWQTNTSVRWLNIFKTAPRQYQRKVEQSIRQMSRVLKGKPHKGTKGQLLYQFAMYHAVLPVIFQYVTLGLPGLLADWDEEDAEDLGRAALIGNLNSFFILGDVLRSLVDTIQDKPWAGDIDIGPLSTLFEELMKPVGKIYYAKNEADKYEAIMELGEGLLQLGAIPAGNIGKWAKNINVIISGDVKTPEEMILRIFNFSKYVIEGDKKNNKNPISPFGSKDVSFGKRKTSFGSKRQGFGGGRRRSF